MDVAMDVLRSMPGSFLGNFTSLPQALKPIAALAEHPGLAAACLLSTEGSSGAVRSLPTLTLCVDASTSPHTLPGTNVQPTGSTSDASSTQDVCTAAFWRCSVDPTQETEGRISEFGVQQRPGAVACQLPVRESTLQGLSLIHISEPTRPY